MARQSRLEFTRRGLIKAALAASAAGMAPRNATADAPDDSPRASRSDARVPVIDVTDLYHPPQDPGDNVDLVTAYGLPEVDLKAVILDVTQRYRRPYVNTADHTYDDPAGHRDPGFIPVWQLNAIFGRNVPCAVGPFEPMKSPEDPMLDAPSFQQTGINLMLRILRESPLPVDVLSFGSARLVAVAYNREPKLMREKVRRMHLCAGSAPAGYREWNVMLDAPAFVRVLRSDMPVAIYPCATDKDVFALGEYNTFWKLPNFGIIREVVPALRRYLAYAFERTNRVDFLAAIEEDPPQEVIDRIAAMPHNVWETAVWMQVSNRRLLRHADGTHRIVPEKSVAASDTVLTNELLPCKVTVRDDGQFDFAPTDKPTNFAIYHRASPGENQRALQEALPALYRSFLVTVQEGAMDKADLADFGPESKAPDCQSAKSALSMPPGTGGPGQLPFLNEGDSLH